MAQDAGLLPPHLAAVLGRLLDASDDHLTAGWWSLGWIARAVLGQDRYGPDNVGGQRTAGRWMAELHRLGWVQREHRFVVEAGRVRATSNLWRLVIPEPLRQAVLHSEDRARARTLKTNPPTRRPQLMSDRRSEADAAIRRRLQQRHDGVACTSCGGSGWIDHPTEPNSVIPCDACTDPVAPRGP